MNEYTKPLPVIDEKNEQFWAATREGVLRLQQCSQCAEVRYPISDWCPRCLSAEFSWEEMSGSGEVAATIVFHQVYHGAFADDVPYNVSLIQLDEGPRMFSNVVGVAPSEVRVGDRVTVFFDDVTDVVTIPRFRRAPNSDVEAK